MEQPALPVQTARCQRRLLWLLGALTVLLLLLWLLCLSLPWLVGRQVQRMLDNASEKGSWQFSIGRIGLFSTDFRLLVPNSADPGGDPWLEVASGQLSYRPLALLRGKIGAVRLDGIQAELRWQEGRWLLPVASSLRRQPATETTAVPGTGPRTWRDCLQALPVSIDEVSLVGVLRLRLEDESSVLPFRLQLQNLKGGDGNDMQLSVRTVLGGNFACLQATVKPADGRFSLAADFSLQGDSLPRPWRSQLPAQASLQGRLVLDGQWNDLTSLPEQLNLELPLQMAIGSADWELTGQPSLSLRRTGDSLTLQVQNMHLRWQQQQAMRLDKLEIKADLAEGNLSGGILLAQENQPAQKLKLSGGWTAPAATNAVERLLALLRGTAKVELQLQTDAENGDLKLNLPGYEFCGQNPELRLSWAGDGDAAAGAVLQLNEFTLRRQLDGLTGRQLAVQAQFSGRELSLQGTLASLAVGRDDWQAEASGIVLAAQGKTGGLQGQLSAAALSVAGPELELQFPGCDLTLAGTLPDNCGGRHYSGRLAVKDGRMQERRTNLTVEEISTELPFFWPLPDASTGVNGYLQLGQISCGKGAIGHLRLDCTWTPGGLQAQGTAVLLGLQTALTGGLQVKPDGALQAEAALQLPQQALPDKLPVREWLPAWKDLELAAELAGEAHFRWESGRRPAGDAHLQVTELNANSAAHKVALRGGKLALEFPRLPEIATAGSQRLSCRELTLGRLAFGPGMVLFRIDNPRLAYLESLRLGWCDGTIRTSSIKISPDSDRLLLTLYGDRLRLPAILGQFGFGSAEGEGRISGSLPLVLSRDNIRFRDGFLYSTPGETGQINLQPSALVRNTAASNEQMQLALEALQDFSYNWVRLALNTDAEALQLKLQLDGKPNQRLYFRPHPQGGGFVKSEVANDFQGLGLNLNIRVPLQEFLHYYGNWQKLTH